jgi:hypothetical protein
MLRHTYCCRGVTRQHNNELEGTSQMTLTARTGRPSLDTTANFTAVTATFSRIPGMPAPDNLTTTTVIEAVNTYDTTERSPLDRIYQGIKGARFLSCVMLGVLTFFVIEMSFKLHGSEWFITAISATLLGLGVWVSFFGREKSVKRAHYNRSLAIYFAATGTVFTLLTMGFHALIWWVTTGQFIL